MPAPPGPLTSLSIAIVVHNSCLEMLFATLTSLREALEQAHAAGLVHTVELNLVENASAPDYREDLRRRLGEFNAGTVLQIRVLALAKNGGFGAGHNAAMASLQADFHLVLNPDVILQRDCLVAGLERLLGAPSIALLSPRVNGADGSRQYLCKAYPTVWVLFLRGFAPGFLRRVFEPRLAAYELRERCAGDSEVPVDIASGACMLIRRQLLDAVDGFDERYFLYFEDFDLSLRLQTQGQLLYYPAMSIVHHGGDAARKGLRHIGWFLRSALRFFGRHGWRWV